MFDIGTILTMISWAIEEEPKVLAAIQNVLAKPNPTMTDWQTEGDAWRADTYAKLVPDSKLPADPTPPASPAA